MITTHTDKRTIVKSIRISPRELELIQSKCRNGKLGFSGFARAAMIAKANEQTNPVSTQPTPWLIR
jgi:hypothetical protein